MIKDGKLPIAIICMFLAFVITWQVRSVTAIEETLESTESLRAYELQRDLIEEQEKTEILMQQILEYKDELQQFSEMAEQSGGLAEVLAQKLETTMILAGQTAVQGQGITVTLTDSRKQNTTGIDESNYIVHDEDLLQVVNELCDAGAEAIALNGERLVATSEIRCAGAIVSVNNKRFSAPFVISAIGNADQLQSALEMRQGVVDSLAVWGIGCEIVKFDNVVIGAYEGAVAYEFAEPVTNNENTGGN